MNVAGTLRAMGIDPARLDPAPPDPARMPGAGERIGRNPKPCVACGRPSCATGILDIPTFGFRWLDRCRDCFLSRVNVEPSRVPATMEGILADLREAAREAGVPLAMVTDPQGDHADAVRIASPCASTLRPRQHPDRPQRGS